MEVCHDLPAWKHSAVHCCYHNIEHSGLEAGYYLMLCLICCIVLLQCFDTFGW